MGRTCRQLTRGSSHRVRAGPMGQGTHQYQIVYREDKPSLVRIHPVDSGTALSTFPNGSDSTTRTDLLQQAHQLYREQKYQNVLTICNHVRCVYCEVHCRYRRHAGTGESCTCMNDQGHIGLLSCSRSSFARTCPQELPSTPNPLVAMNIVIVADLFAVSQQHRQLAVDGSSSLPSRKFPAVSSVQRCLHFVGSPDRRSPCQPCKLAPAAWPLAHGSAVLSGELLPPACCAS